MIGRLLGINGIRVNRHSADSWIVDGRDLIDALNGLGNEITNLTNQINALTIIINNLPSPPPPAPAPPITFILRDTWSPLPPGAFGPTDGNAAFDTICAFRDGTATRVWDASVSAWLLD